MFAWTAGFVGCRRLFEQMDRACVAELATLGESVDGSWTDEPGDTLYSAWSRLGRQVAEPPSYDMSSCVGSERYYEMRWRRCMQRRAAVETFEFVADPRAVRPPLRDLAEKA